jgi:hypothetical protein
VISIPYENSLLPAYRFTPEHPKGTLVMVDWLDSMRETGKEPILHALRNEEN